MTIVKEEHHAVSSKLGHRHVQVILLFLGMAIAYALRVCMSVGIVAMRTKEEGSPDFPVYDWSSNTSTMILSSFFWGYVITQIPSGQFANTKSAQKLLSCGIFISSVLNMLTHFLANYGYVPVICCRVAMGLAQGCLLPCVQTLLSRWVPPLERARLGSLVMNGPQLGTVVAMPISGFLASSIGWPSIFYVFGAVGIAWSLAFFFLGSDRPSDHPKICPREAHYINDSLGNLDKTGDSKPLNVPWKAILTSPPMWALIIVHCGHNWGFYTLLTMMPTYMKNILNFDISKSGGYSALPYIAMWLLGFPISYISDLAIKKGTSVEVVRKISNSIGLWVPAIAMIVLCLVTSSNTAVVIAILAVAVGFNSGITCGFQINHIDLSPNFAGPMMAITNGSANVLGILAPLICGVIVTKETDINQWRIVFYITAGIYLATNLVFVLFGKADIQSWNEPEGNDAPVKRSRVSVISITGEPTSLSLPEQIKEEECETPC